MGKPGCASRMIKKRVIRRAQKILRRWWLMGLDYRGSQAEFQEFVWFISNMQIKQKHLSMGGHTSYTDEHFWQGLCREKEQRYYITVT